LTQGRAGDMLFETQSHSEYARERKAAPVMNTRLLLSPILLAGYLSAQVTYDRLLHADREPQNWLTYSGGYSGNRYSPLNQINRDNVKSLQMK
jgi:glucose dehydrogenase